MLTRRQFLGTGVMTAAAGVAATMLPVPIRSLLVQSSRSVKSCIILWLSGGASQFETFDPKPGRSTGGPTKSIATAVAGTHLSEFMPQTARLMKNVAVIRTLHHRDMDHMTSTMMMHTAHNPRNPAVTHPGIGSVISAMASGRDSEIPGYVSISNMSPPGPGFLGTDHAAWVIRDPRNPTDNSMLPPGMTEKRFTSRLQLLMNVEREFVGPRMGPEIKSHEAAYNKALMSTSPKFLKLLDVAKEGKARAQFGSSPLADAAILARRLVEGGVSCVELSTGGWDTHTRNYQAHSQLVTELDKISAALLQDLSARGMLQNTLVVWMSEFGRTPNINNQDGRDHYSRAFSVMLAGAGIKAGQVIGRTDDKGIDIADRGVTVEDFFATIYTALGIRPDTTFTTPSGRPIKLVDNGTPVKELLG